MIWLILAVLVWGLLHSLLASHKIKKEFHRRFGEHLVRFYRLAYNLFSGLSFLPVLGIAAVIPDRILYSVTLPWAVLMILGEILAIIVILMGLRKTDIWEFLGLRRVLDRASIVYPNGPVETVNGDLVTSGVYRFVRHPLYSAGIALIWLLPLMTINVLAINIGLTIYVVIGAYLEERKLRQEFGNQYTDYAAVTPMFIPFLKGNKMPR
jgi:protein-S-isoprenylcysteine O-methyltransferase Ste14